MKKCPHCAEQIQDEASVCPHCRRKQPLSPEAKAKRRWRRLGVGVASVALSMAVWGCYAAGRYHRISEECQSAPVDARECIDVVYRNGDGVLALLPGPHRSPGFFADVDLGVGVVLSRLFGP